LIRLIFAILGRKEGSGGSGRKSRWRAVAVSPRRVAKSAQLRFCRFAGLIAPGTNSGNYHNYPPDPSRPNRDTPVRFTDTVVRNVVA